MMINQFGLMNKTQKRINLYISKEWFYDRNTIKAMINGRNIIKPHLKLNPICGGLSIFYKFCNYNKLQVPWTCNGCKITHIKCRKIKMINLMFCAHLRFSTYICHVLVFQSVLLLPKEVPGGAGLYVEQTRSWVMFLKGHVKRMIRA